jgi:hypothetical protein
METKDMSHKQLPPRRGESKDVTPRENGLGEGGSKKSANSLPKILRLVERSGSLQPQRVRCGKTNCRCARGDLHEGYYYLFQSTPAGLRKYYVRRKDVPAVRAAIAERRERRHALRSEFNEAMALLRRMMSRMMEV